MVPFPTLKLVGMDLTCFGARFFVGRFVVALLLLFLTPRTSAALRTIVDPNLDVSLVRRGLRNRWEVIDVVRAL